MKLKIIVACLALAVSASAETTADDGVGVLSSSQDFDGLYSDFQAAFLPVIVPGGEMFLQPVEGLVPFDQEGFECRFLAKLIGTMHPVSGAPVYSVFAVEDAFSHEVVIFNEDLIEIARIPRPESYSPFAWLESKYGAAALATDLMVLYNPARMIGVPNHPKRVPRLPHRRIGGAGNFGSGRAGWKPAVRFGGRTGRTHRGFG